MPYVLCDSWEEACRLSKHDIAIGLLYIEHQGRQLEVEVRKRRHGNAWLQWKGTAIRIRKATTREVDDAKRWRPF